jgi:hypothetical protein
LLKAWGAKTQFLDLPAREIHCHQWAEIKAGFNPNGLRLPLADWCSLDPSRVFPTCQSCNGQRDREEQSYGLLEEGLKPLGPSSCLGQANFDPSLQNPAPSTLFEIRGLLHQGKC